jgi:hypothetical protein
MELSGLAYNASGNRLMKETSDADFWDYISGIVYKNNELDYVLNEGGRVIYSNEDFIYEYFLKDHLGNTRATYKSTNDAADQLQEFACYPFGMTFLNKWESSSDNKYLYNGKELQEEYGLDWYDYGNWI